MQSNWQYLLNRHRNQQLPHALLLSDPKSSNAENLARNFSQLLLCTQKDVAEQACNSCAACKLFQANTHPDFYLIQPEATGKVIKIDQIRELITQLNETAHQPSYKVVIINPAEAMHISAVNALLKTLEEPTANTLIILVSKQAGLLPATIRSRCQLINFQEPNKIESGNANNTQQKLFIDLQNITENKIDPLKIAANWMKEPLREIIDSLVNIIMDLIRSESGTINIHKLFSYLDRLYQLRQPTGATANLNQQLLLEDLFCTWYEYTHP